MDIININVGQCGRKVGDNLMRRIHSDHFSEKEPIGKHQTFFREGKNKYLARSIFLDFDIDQNTDLLTQSNSFYLKSNFLTHLESSQGIYAIPMYNSRDLQSEVLQLIRKQIQISQSVSGMILTSSYCGGSGSGLSSIVLQVLRENYPDRMLQTFRLMPQFQLYTHPNQIYNTTFSLNYEVEQVNMSFMFDNGMLQKSLLLQKNFSPTFQHINDKIGQAIADSTIPYRFKGELNTCQRKIASNLIMFPRLHFFNFSKTGRHTGNPLLSSLSFQNFLITNYFENVSNANQSKIFTVYAGVRSKNLIEKDISPTVKQYFKQKNIQFEEWIPDNIHFSLHEPIKGKESASIFVNGRQFFPYMSRISQLFTLSFRRKAFIYRYIEAGMDQMQFTEAESNMNDLCSEYQPAWMCEEYIDEQLNVQ